jgi:5-methylcytosine-specific restriction enzyme subunit McrC
VVLHSGGVTDLLVNSGLEADTLLVRMDTLWERMVRRMVTEAVVSLGGQVVPTANATAIRVLGDVGGHKPFRPDCLVRVNSIPPRFVPLDAKYKHYDSKPVSPDDLHQLLTYITGYAKDHKPIAVIVHPADHSGIHRTLRVSGPHGDLGQIFTLGLDVNHEPAANARRVQQLVSNVIELG